MNMKKRLGRVSQHSIFQMDGHFVWCGTMTKGDNGLYYLYFSFWPKGEDFYEGWVKYSKVGYAVSNNPYGGFVYQGIALEGSGHGWDADCIHNPTVIKHDGKYYMYYMGNYGTGEYWSHRNHQRIGVAVADHPAGPWTRSAAPVLDVTPGSFDALMVSNPSVTKGGDGRFYMIYKAVSDQGELPRGGAVVCGMAVADHPLGPFKKYGKPILRNPENDWSIEDAFIWYENGKFYCLAKDFHGYFTKAGNNQIALFACEDGISWQVSEPPLAVTRNLTWEDGTTIDVRHLERPQLYMEDGKPVALLSACAFYTEPTDAVRAEGATSQLSACANLDTAPLEHTFNICIPIVK